MLYERQRLFVEEMKKKKRRRRRRRRRRNGKTKAIDVGRWSRWMLEGRRSGRWGHDADANAGVEKSKEKSSVIQEKIYRKRKPISCQRAHIPRPTNTTQLVS